jgi:hypothetical protein
VWEDIYSQWTTLPHCISKALIVIGYKRGDPHNIANYRPISLTNNDYKILAHAYLPPLVSCAQHLVGPEQTGFIKGRDIRDNILLVSLLPHHIREDFLTLAHIDFQKAFDKLIRSFIFLALERYGFHPNFIKAMRIIYAPSLAQTFINGFLSKPFPIGKGVRQGCPLAAVLYGICTEPLRLAAINNPNWLGATMTTTGHVHKLVLQADDTGCILTSLADWQAAKGTIELFCRATGQAVNWDKTTFIPLKGSLPLPAPTALPVRYIGAYLPTTNPSPDYCTQHEKALRSIQLWTHAAISPLGKAVVARTFIQSLFTFSFAISCIPADQLSTIQKLLWEFLFRNNWKAKVKYCITARPRDQGGLKFPMLDMRAAAVKAHTIIRALHHASWPWARLFWAEAEAVARRVSMLHPLTPVVEDSKTLHKLKGEGLVGEALFWWHKLSLKCTWQTETKWVLNRFKLVGLLSPRPAAEHFGLPTRTTVAHLYSMFLDVLHPLPPNLPQRKWENIYKLSLLPPSQLGFLWRFCHKKLPIKSEDPCPFCQQQVSHDHLFGDCINYKELLSLIKQNCTTWGMTDHWPFTSATADTDPLELPLACRALFTITHWSIWVTYTSCIFGKHPPASMTWRQPDIIFSNLRLALHSLILNTHSPKRLLPFSVNNHWIRTSNRVKPRVVLTPLL